MTIATAKTSAIRFALFVAFVAACGCDRKGSPVEILKVPEPVAFEGMDPQAQEQYRERRQAIDALHAREQVSARDLGHAYGDLALWYHAYEQPEAARVAYENAERLDPKDFRWAHYLGRLAAREGKRDEARTALERALTLQPGEPTTQKALAALGSAEGPSPDDPLMREVWRLRQPVPVEEAGRRAFAAGRTAAAIAAARRAVEAEPEAARHRVNLAAALLQAGQREEAVAELRGVLARDPNHAPAHFAHAVALASLGRTAEAAAAYESAIATDPNHKEAHFNLALLLIAEGKAEKALSHLERVLTLDPSLERARLPRALALITLRRYREARQRLEEDLALQPQGLESRLLLARLLAAAPDDAVRSGPRALGMATTLYNTTQSLAALETLAMAYAEMHDFKGAVQRQSAALTAAQRAQRTRHLERLQARLALYEARQPCREPWLPGEEAEFPLRGARDGKTSTSG